MPNRKNVKEAGFILTQGFRSTVSWLYLFRSSGEAELSWQKCVSEESWSLMLARKKDEIGKTCPLKTCLPGCIFSDLLPLAKPHLLVSITSQYCHQIAPLSRD